MSSKRKKRAKRYTGKDAKIEKPIVKRYSVEDKPKSKEWLEDNKQTLIIRGIQAGVGAIIGLIIFFIFMLLA